MAIPTSMSLDLGQRTGSGIILGLAPSTGVPFRMELQRSTQSSTASTNWTSIFLDPTSQSYRYTALLPLSTRTFYFRARHYGLGYSNGPFTATVSAKPAKLPEAFSPLTPMRNSLGNVEVLGGDLWLSSAKTAKVGTQQTAGTITKTVRIGVGEVIPISNAQTFTLQTTEGTLRPGTAGVSAGFMAGVIIPKGATITGGAVRHFRQNNTTADASVWDLRKITDTPTATAILSFTHATTGWVTTTGSVSQLVGNEAYLFSGSLRGNATPANARFLRAEITYTMPSYDKSL